MSEMGLYDYREFIVNENACYKLLREIRWSKGIKCPRCKHKKQWHYLEQGISKYRCKKCNYKFSDTTGTIFQKSRTPLSKWILTIALFKIGISARQMSKEVKVTYKAAWSMMHKMRHCMQKDKFFKQLSGHVEIDETYYGGREHRNRKVGKTGFKNKMPVVGIRSRDGKVKTIYVPKIKSHKLKKVIQKYVQQGSIIYTDDYNMYRNLKLWGYQHFSINKLFGYLKEPNIHTNSVEGYWRLSKTKLYATHHKISRQHLSKYLAEREYKFNHRDDPDFVRDMLKLLLCPLRG